MMKWRSRPRRPIAGIVSTSGSRCPCPQGVPWFPDDVEAWCPPPPPPPVRWVLLHVIEETARHGPATPDIVRELGPTGPRSIRFSWPRPKVLAGDRVAPAVDPGDLPRREVADGLARVDAGKGRMARAGVVTPLST